MANVKKKSKVVMLPTNEKANSLKGYLDKSLLFNYQKEYRTIEAEKGLTGYFNLYILSDEEIKEGDWILHNNTIHQVRINKGLYLSLYRLDHIDVRADLCEKIIATTDKYLELSYNGGRHEFIPQPSQSFLEKFVEEYNKGNQIKEVMVEYEGYKINGMVDEATSYRPKVNPKDTTITIRMVKDSWSREEVIILLSKHFVDAGSKIGLGSNVTDFTKQWIEENL